MALRLANHQPVPSTCLCKLACMHSGISHGGEGVGEKEKLVGLLVLLVPAPHLHQLGTYMVDSVVSWSPVKARPKHEPGLSHTDTETLPLNPKPPRSPPWFRGQTCSFCFGRRFQSILQFYPPWVVIQQSHWLGCTHHKPPSGLVWVKAE